MSDLRDQLQQTLSGTHTLERELGGGGMSRVFVANETRLNRKVVVKVLSPELAQGISVDRFEREIQTVAALQQANIVPVISAGTTSAFPFYTMPFVEGESLRALVSRGPLGTSDVIGIMRDVSKALAYAHQHGVVHRDIKPDNVLLSGGTAVVTDFGIAKAISAARGPATQSETLTQLGTSIGTPAYMAPEQAAGDPSVDHRADIYSLGCMVYELLAGQAPFAGRSPQKLLAAHMSEMPIPIADVRPDVPSALADLVTACLAKDPNDRPQTANDIVRLLGGLSEGSGAQSIAMQRGGLKRALLIYALAVGAVAILAKAAIVGIGLPDWVFPGAMVVMALGLPMILWTAYVQSVARKAMLTPGGSQPATHSTLATMALKAAPKASWYRTARGGAYALGAFTAIVAVFMIMRAMGIGPVGSLIASGDFKARDRVIITDFTVSNGDSALGRVVGDAIRAGLADSRVFTTVSPAEVAAALQRMQQPPTARISRDLARQIALREGVKAVVDGDVTPVGASYIVVVRLVTADSGRELMSYRATASSSDAIIQVADELSRKLRAKAGESLRKVQGTPALAYASTGSLEALRKYSEGARANDAERDYVKAIRLLREAVALDSNFAEAWRKLSVSIRNSGQYPPSASDSSIRKAFSLVDRMTERERDAVLAYYYSGSPGFDRAKAIATYERMLARGDSVVATNNLGIQYASRREFAKAESLYRANIVVSPGVQNAYGNLMGVLNQQSKYRERDSVLAVARKRFPGLSSWDQQAIGILFNEGRFAEGIKALDSARKAGDARAPTWAMNQQTGVATMFGKYKEANALAAQVRAIDSAAGRAGPAVFMAAGKITSRYDLGMPFDAELKAFDAEVEKYNIESQPVSDRPYFYFATVNAIAGRVDKAKALLARYEATVRDTAVKRWDMPNMNDAQANIAFAEKRWKEAIALARAGDRRADGPVGACPECLPLALTRIFGEAGMVDSAIAAFEDYKKTAVGSRPRQGPDQRIGTTNYERIAKLYDAKGDTANAVLMYKDFIELWKDADPELQPRVKAARDRVRQLTPVEKPR